MLPIDAARKSRWLSFDDDPKMVKEFLGDEFMGYEVHKKDLNKAFPLLKEPSNVMCVPYYLYSSVKTSDEVIYEVAKAMAKAKFKGGFMSSFNPKNVADSKNKIPFHKGAIRAYTELGLMK